MGKDQVMWSAFLGSELPREMRSAMDQFSYSSTPINSKLHYARSDQESGWSTVVRLMDMYMTWHQRRRSRADLAGMPDLMLKEFGLSRGRSDHGREKPFWRRSGAGQPAPGPVNL